MVSEAHLKRAIVISAFTLLKTCLEVLVALAPARSLPLKTNNFVLRNIFLLLSLKSKTGLKRAYRQIELLSRAGEKSVIRPPAEIEIN